MLFAFTWLVRDPLFLLLPVCDIFAYTVFQAQYHIIYTESGSEQRHSIGSWIFLWLDCPTSAYAYAYARITEIMWSGLRGVVLFRYEIVEHPSTPDVILVF